MSDTSHVDTARHLFGSGRWLSEAALQIGEALGVAGWGDMW